MPLSTVKRVFSSVKEVINLPIQEYGLDINNPFSKTCMPYNDSIVIRKPIPIRDIKHIQSLCRKYDDDLRWLVTLLSDTRMRLGEGVGLSKSDINLNCEIPHIKLIPHPCKRLKTMTSVKVYPINK